MAADASFVYAAGHSYRVGEGISWYRFDSAAGALTFLEKSDEVNRVLYLVLHPRKAILYAVSDMAAGRDVADGDEASGLIWAFGIDPASGRLSLLNRRRTGGTTPCFVSIDQTGRLIAVAHFRGRSDVGSLAIFPVADDGRVGPRTQFLKHTGSSIHPQRQLCSHIHAAMFDTKNRHLLVTDLGRDKLMSYRVELSAGKLSSLPVAEADVKPGSGPRHMAFHPSGRTLYLINEINSTLTTFAYDAATGELSELHTCSTLPPEYKGQNTCADIHVHPSGTFVYGSNRGHDSLAIFTAGPQDGRLTLAGHASTEGKEPRGFMLTPIGISRAVHHPVCLVLFAVTVEGIGV